MENRQTKERGILKLEPRHRVTIESPARDQLTPQESLERAPSSSPQPSVDRLSVTWAEPQESMASSGVNLFHLPSETPINNEVKFSPLTGAEGSEDEDYSASLSAVLRQRRASSVRRSRIGRGRRPSSPFIQDRRRSSVLTTSSGETAISIEDAQTTLVTQEEIFETIHLHKEVLGSVKQQPLGMRKKLKIVKQAKTYIKRHQGQLQERLAQSKSTRDIYARCSIVLNAKWQQLNREIANLSNVLIPWELRIKEIESHFGSVVASYFTFLRWLFWVNLVIGFILMVFVIIPEYLTSDKETDRGRKEISDEDWRNATKLLTLWEFEGVLKCSPIFYGYYTNIEREYRMPLAYFLTGLTVYIYSFVATLRKMAENSRMSKLSEKDDECIFSWKLFTGWDFMIGNAETAHNRIASIILGFKEALLEEAEKKKNLRNWKILTLRVTVNLCVVILLIASAYAVVTVVSRSDIEIKEWSWWHDNQTTIVVTVISIMFPVFFELLGYLEHYHPRKQLRLQLARIMLLNLLNLYSLIFALFSKIEGMSNDLDRLQPKLGVNATTISNNTLNDMQLSFMNIPILCREQLVPCKNEVFYYGTNNTEQESSVTTTVTSFTVPYISENSSITEAFVAYNVADKATPLLPIDNLIQKAEYTQTTESTSRLYDLSINDSDLELGNDNNNSIDYFIYNNTNSGTSTQATETPEDKTIIFERDGTTTNDTNTGTSTQAAETPEYKTIIFERDGTTTNAAFSNEKINTTDYLDPISTNMVVSGLTEIEDTYVDMLNLTFLNPGTSEQGSSTATPMITDEQYEQNKTSPTALDSFQTSKDNITPSPSLPITLYDKIATAKWSDRCSVITKNICPEIFFNYTAFDGESNITTIIHITNCTNTTTKCYKKVCEYENITLNNTNISSNITVERDIAYIDKKNHKVYNLTKATKKKLDKLCWETMFGQELVKLTMMDLVFVLLGTLFMDFFRAIFVRCMNKCWCWNLEKKFPEYGDFKIAENILHLINNQGMVWMGMFFSPGLVVLNIVKLIIMMYLRSWAVMTCNVPHEVVFRVSKSNNFYLALLLTMLFLCVLPVGYSIVWIKPSWHCGPFSEYDKIYHILTNNIYKVLPNNLNFALEYVTSPAIVIPLLVLLILIIYYLTSLTNSLREANNDLKIQLRRERTEERRKMFQLADTRRRAGSCALENTPFARWKKTLPSLVISKSIDSDDQKTGSVEDSQLTRKKPKKKGGIFANIVALVLDKKAEIALDEQNLSPSPNIEDDPDTEFHENLPTNILKIKDIQITKKFADQKYKLETSLQRRVYDIKTDSKRQPKDRQEICDESTRISTKPVLTQSPTPLIDDKTKCQPSVDLVTVTNIPVITISHTESDDEILQEGHGNAKIKSENCLTQKGDHKQGNTQSLPESPRSGRSLDCKALKRQSSVDSGKSNSSIL